MADSAISGLTTAGTPSASAVGVIADLGVDYKISLANMVKAGGAVILSPSDQQSGTMSISGAYTSGTSSYGPTSALVVGTATIGTLSRVVINDDGTNAVFAAVSGGGVILSASAGSKTATLSTAGDLTLSAGSFKTGSTSIANGASTINGALAIAGALTGVTTLSLSSTITASEFIGSGAGLTAATVPNAALVTAPVTAVTASGNLSSSGGVTPALSLSATPTFNSLTLSVTPLAVSSGGTGSATQNFVDLTTDQSIAGDKTFTGTVNIPASGITAGTLNIGVGGAQTGVLPLANGGTGALSLLASPFAVLSPASAQTGSLSVTSDVTSGGSFIAGLSRLNATSFVLSNGVTSATLDYGVTTTDVLTIDSIISGTSFIAGSSQLNATSLVLSNGTTDATLDFGTTLTGAVSSTQPVNFAPMHSYQRNKIINGAMAIDQRHNGASITPASGDYLVDRWTFVATQTGKFSSQQNAGSVGAPAGFTYYQGVTSQSAYSVASGDTFILEQAIEVANMLDLQFGLSNAKAITISFWARSSLTGTFGAAVCNYASTQSFPFSYSLPTANTWTLITVTIPGCTTGVWGLNLTDGYMYLRFGLGSGATFCGTNGTWQAGNFVQPSSTVSVVGTSGATFYVTGVQLETGTIATPFEQRQYGTELALCQRYYQTFANLAAGTNGSTNITFFGSIGIPLRATPTVGQTALLGFQTYSGGTTFTQSSISTIFNGTSATGIFYVAGNFAGLASNQGGQLESGMLTLSAEL